MFRITEDPSSGNLVQCLAKNYKNDSVMPVDMDRVGVMAAYSDLLCMCVVSSLYMKAVPSYTVNYTHAQHHNTDLVHVNGHDRMILVIFSQALYKAPWCWITFKYFIILILSTYYTLCISWIIKCSRKL